MYFHFFIYQIIKQITKQIINQPTKQTNKSNSNIRFYILSSFFIDKSLFCFPLPIHFFSIPIFQYPQTIHFSFHFSSSSSLLHLHLFTSSSPPLHLHPSPRPPPVAACVWGECAHAVHALSVGTDGGGRGRVHALSAQHREHGGLAVHTVRRGPLRRAGKCSLR